MEKFNTQFVEYIKNKRDKLIREQKISSIFDNLIKWLLILLNLTIIAIAIAVIVIESKRYVNLPKPKGSILDELGLTIVLASFIVLTFVFTLFIAVYSQIMQFKNYKKAIREITYITYKAEEDSKYSKEDFDNDLKEIQNFYLNKPKKSKWKLFWSALLKGGKK